MERHRERAFDIEIFNVYPHAYAWRLRVDTEPPCVSMRVPLIESLGQLSSAPLKIMPKFAG